MAVLAGHSTAYHRLLIAIAEQISLLLPLAVQTTLVKSFNGLRPSIDLQQVIHFSGGRTAGPLLVHLIVTVHHDVVDFVLKSFFDLLPCFAGDIRRGR